MEKLLAHLYIGGDTDYEKLKDRRDFSFLRCAKFGPAGHKETLGYATMAAPKGPNYLIVKKGKHLLALNWLDLDDPNFIDVGMIKIGLDFIKEQLASGQNVLVSCNAGQSRGPSMGLMYLRSIGEMPYPFHAAEKIYRVLYPSYEPKMALRQFMRSHWTSLDNIEVNNGRA